MNLPTENRPDTSPPTKRRRVAMLTSVGDRCGIAAYTRELTAALAPYADVTVEPISEGKQPLEHYQEQAERLNAADVVHIQHEHAFWGGILPNHSAFWNLRYLLSPPVVLTAHTTSRLRVLLKVDRERRPLHRLAKEALLWRRGYRDSVETAPFLTGHCIVHTEAARQELAARGANPKYIHTIPAGVPEARDAPTHGAAFRERFGVPDRRLVALFGYISPNKGYELMLDALTHLPSDVTFVIAGGVRIPGEQPYADTLRETIAARGLTGRVVMTGYLSEGEVAEAMAASEIVVTPHTLATGSYSVMIPLTYGKPVVASDLDCFREIAGANAALALFPAGDAAELAARLRELLADPAARGRLSAKARVYAAAHSWGAVARRTATVYESAIADVTRLSHHTR